MTNAWNDQGEESGDVEYSLVLPFIDQSPEFCLGFEAGQQYARMYFRVAPEFEQTVHTENLGQLRAAAIAAGWTVTFEPLDENFSIMYAKEARRLDDSLT